MQSSNDYRESHLASGASYDATIARGGFDAYMAFWEHRHLSAVVRKLFPRRADRYMDFACGTGRVTATVAPLCKETVAVDVSASMMAMARERVPEACFHLCDLTREHADLGAFDLITAFRFFGNAQDELREGALRAITARLSPGGWLVTNNHRNPAALSSRLDKLTGGDAAGMDLTQHKFVRLLERHGLRVHAQYPIGTWMFRSALFGSLDAEHPRAQRLERWFSRRAFAGISPDVIVVAQRA